MKKAFFVLFLIFSTLALAQGTRLWKETGYDDFERGTAKGVAIRSDGLLELAPAFSPLYTSPSTFIWSIAAEKDGTVYAATGAPARLYRITPDGRGTVIFEPKELQVQSVVIGGDGAIYVATSPDGKVYRITRTPAKGVPTQSEFTSSVFFDPKTKYIWDQAFDAQGRLYVATGDRGEIYRVEKTGQGVVFFKSDEAHIRVLAFDPKGNLIAGSDGSGLIYRITPSGEGFVLYSAPKKEITALAIDAGGNIYAAGTGDKHGGNSGPTNPPPNPPQGGQSGNAPNVNLAGSDVYMVAPDGSPRRLWTSRDDIVYALAFDNAGHLIAGTGNRGRIFSIEKNGTYTYLLKASANQVTAFAHAPNGLYCSSSNLGKVFTMSNALEPEGTFESDVEDAHIFSRWGRAEVRGRGNFELFARSGNVDNPDRNWSPWTRIDLSKDARVDIPAARFVQWRANLKPANPPTQIDEVAINYLSKNVAPVVDDIAVQTGGRFPLSLHSSGPDTFPVTFGSGSSGSSHNNNNNSDSPPSATRDRSYVAVRWAAHDDNDDDLVYSVYYRGDNEHDWKLLKGGLTEKYYSFDSGLLPDGGYTLKVVASDAPSHTAEDALTDERQSTRFEIDNTPPRIQNLAARAEGQQMHVTFSATDDFSTIKRAEYSIDAGEWQYLEPVGQLSDAKTENYDFNALFIPPPQSLEEQAEQKRTGKAKNSSPPSGEHVVVVRVYDRYDNVATSRYVVR